MSVKNLSVRLNGLPWQWVRAQEMFEGSEELISFIGLSKDAPDSVALAVMTTEGYEFHNTDMKEGSFLALCALRFGEEKIQWDDTDGHLVLANFCAVYIPLGLALDVEAWRELSTDPSETPCAYYVDGFMDMTRDSDEGGHGDLFFSAYFTGSGWWVVDWPEGYEPH